MRLSTGLEEIVRSGKGIAAATVTGLLVVSSFAIGKAQSAPEQVRLPGRFQLAVMEAALEQAVQLGATNLNMQVQSVVPDMIFLTGAARARGFRLEDYGVFFDVDVPMMRRSLAWSFRVLQQTDRGMNVALQTLKRRAESLGDEELERAVQQLERQLPRRQRVSSEGQSPSAAVSPMVLPEASERPVTGSPILENPAAAYTNEVKNALINVMLEYGAPIGLGPNEWLTIAARDQEGSRLPTGDPYNLSTIVLRVRGSDIAALRAGQIDIAEARTRVQVKEY
jgi:hypothetical protein